MSTERDGSRGSPGLLQRLEAHLESLEMLGVDIGQGREVIDFLAHLPMGDVEHLLGASFSATDRERILNLVEHRKGQLDDHELPESEAERRAGMLKRMRERGKEHTRRGRRKRARSSPQGQPKKPDEPAPSRQEDDFLGLGQLGLNDLDDFL